MKTSSSFLYDLARRLTKSEKRYIKVGAGSGEKNYILLLDALLAQTEFDENKLIADHKGAKFLKHLPVNKRYLYELILESLMRFGQDTLEQKVFAKINAANTLIRKDMFAAALSELKKGQKIAEKYELFELQIMLFNIEKSLLSKRKLKKKDEASIHQIYQDVANSLAQLKNTNTYWYLSQRITQFQLRFQKIQTEEQQEYINSLINAPEFRSLEHTTNFRSKLYFYQANATYQFILGNTESAYTINRSFLDLLEEYPHFLRLYAERYLATLNNMLIDSLVNGKYDLLQEEIERMESIPKQAEFKSLKNIESRIFRQRYLLLLNLCLRQQDFAKALMWIPEIEKGLEQFGKKIEKHHRITFYYLSAYLLFQNERYDAALKWNNYILNDPKENVVKEIFYFARVLNLLIHFELQNFMLLESLLLSTPKYLRSRRTIYATEKTLFRFLNKILKVFDKKEKKELTNRFLIDVDVHFKNPAERRVFNYLDLRLWGGRIKEQL